jgi:hypothetical protein
MQEHREFVARHLAFVFKIASADAGGTASLRLACGPSGRHLSFGVLMIRPLTSSLPPALVLQVRLMLGEARKRLDAGDILQADLAHSSDSGYLLRLLAFELLLKAMLTALGVRAKQSHSYRNLWACLPSATQSRLLEKAGDRMAGVADYSDLPRLLSTWSSNFVRLRYPFECYEGLTEEQYHARGEAWIAGGALMSEADFVYYPNELRGLLDAFVAELTQWLNAAT